MLGKIRHDNPLFLRNNVFCLDSKSAESLFLKMKSIFPFPFLFIFQQNKAHYSMESNYFVVD